MRDFNGIEIQEKDEGRKMKAIPLIVTDIVNNSYQCYKVMADEDMTEVDVIAAIKKSNNRILRNGSRSTTRL